MEKFYNLGDRPLVESAKQKKKNISYYPTKTYAVGNCEQPKHMLKIMGKTILRWMFWVFYLNLCFTTV